MLGLVELCDVISWQPIRLQLTTGPIGLILYLGVPEKIFLKVVFPKPNSYLIVFFGFIQTKKLFGDLKNSYFSYLRHFYNRSVMADILRIFNFLENNFHEIHFNHIIEVYILAFMHIHRFNSFKTFRKRILDLFFNFFEFCTVFCVGHYISWNLCLKHILFKGRGSVALRWYSFISIQS